MGTCPSKRITNDDTIEDTGQEGDRTGDTISKRSWAADRFLNEILSWEFMLRGVLYPWRLRWKMIVKHEYERMSMRIGKGGKACCDGL
jgi:hypothetical protein